MLDWEPAAQLRLRARVTTGVSRGCRNIADPGAWQGSAFDNARPLRHGAGGIA
jgi:hypothetical protein